MTSLATFNLERDLQHAVLVSESNHRVFRWEELFIKISSKEYPYLQGLQNEAALLQALGRTHKFIAPNVLITENLGRPLKNEELTLFHLARIFTAAKTIHALKRPVRLAEITRKDLLAHRITMMKRAPLYEEARPLWQDLLSLTSELPATTLVHGDLHLNNVVRNKDEIFLVDLESAHYSVPEWDWATLWIALRLEGFPLVYRQLLLEVVEDGELFKSALYTKLAMVITWSVMKNDAQGLLPRLDLARMLLEDDIVLTA